jgi:putative membrane protein
MHRMNAGWRCATAAALLASSGAALAHASSADHVSAWRIEAWVVALMLSSAAGYAVGLQRLWRRAGPGRGIRPRQALAFAAGWVSLAAALSPPLDPLGTQLFSAHMVQHELMMVVAAPLLCLSQPIVAWTWACPLGCRRLLGRVTGSTVWSWAWQRLTAPLAAWALHASVLWGWHLPALFDAALGDNGLHTLQHLSFLGSALLFWWAVLRPSPRAAGGAALLYVFTTMMHTAGLGALLTLSDRAWYSAYNATVAGWGLDALEDQQLGGLVMWVPAGAAYLVCALALVARHLRLPAPSHR